MTSMKYEINIRRPQWKMTSIKETSMEDIPNRIQHQWKMASIEADLNGRQPQ